MAAPAKFAAVPAPEPSHLLHPGYGHKVLQAWQGAGPIRKESLVFPLFIVDDVRKQPQRTLTREGTEGQGA
jgi:hypothetical protein